MEDISVRAVFIGVGIFVTVAIFTMAFASFNQIKEIYKLVDATDTTIHSEFDQFYSVYHDKEISAMELLNVVKKFEDDPQIGINVSYTGQTIVKNSDDIDSNVYKTESARLKYCLQNNKYGFQYKNKYKGAVKNNVGGFDIVIEFTKI